MMLYWQKLTVFKKIDTLNMRVKDSVLKRVLMTLETMFG